MVNREDNFMPHIPGFKDSSTMRDRNRDKYENNINHDIIKIANYAARNSETLDDIPRLIDEYCLDNNPSLLLNVELIIIINKAAVLNFNRKIERTESKLDLLPKKVKKTDSVK